MDLEELAFCLYKEEMEKSRSRNKNRKKLKTYLVMQFLLQNTDK